ncbi:MAG: peptide deformylase [Chlamydiota bacterium]
MILPLRYYGDPVLRKKALFVESITEDVRKLVFNMIETMDAKKGVGLAANQVGVLLKIFIIRPEISNKDGDISLGDPEVYINPILSQPTQETDFFSEGCLSFPGFHLDIERPKGIHIKAMNLEGQWFEEDILGFKAREIMHENDHLHGAFFIDRYKGSKKAIEPILRKLKKKYSST